MTFEIDHSKFHVEILTPKQNTQKLDEDLQLFATRYTRVIQEGHIASITDNPMGMMSFQATEIIPELDLPVETSQLLIHLNTFHTKQALDEILATASDMGVRNLLAITGDGSERLPKLSPASIGMKGNSVTSVELMQYINKEHPGKFCIGVAFNPYEPIDHEIEKMKKKVDAGAKFIITQPVIGKNDKIDLLKPFNIPVIIDAWMSKKLHLLSECVGYEIPEDTPYDPVKNLIELRTNYPHAGLYLALLNTKTQLPLLKDLLP